MPVYHQDPDYKNQFFQFPELTKIQDEPETQSLIVIRNEVKANAMTVHTILGGGAYGHLGLVLTPEQYAQVPDSTPYEKPEHPGVFEVVEQGTQYQILANEHKYQEAIRLFREVQSVELALVQQIVAAIEPKYLLALRDRTTNKIENNIAEIFSHLFDTYGDITTEDLTSFRTRLEGLRYPANEPIDTIFTEVENYQELCEIAESPITEKQTIDYGYMLIMKTLKYKSTLKAWNALPTAGKDWKSFKKMFREAQKAMRKTGELHSNVGINHTELLNVVSEGVKQGLISATPPTSEIDMIEHANSVNENTGVTSFNDQSLISQLDAMTERMNQMQQMLLAPQQLQVPQQSHGWNSYANQNSNNWNSQGRHQNNQGDNWNAQGRHQNNQGDNWNSQGRHQNNQGDNWNSQGRNQNRQNQRGNNNRRFNKYCWTHGGSGHRGKGCMTKASGHKDDATFSNKMGGSTQNCWN